MLESVERRRASRISRRLMAALETSERKFQGIVLNFSTHGFFLKTRQLLRPRETCFVPIRFDDGTVSRVKGKVIWSRVEPVMAVGSDPSGMGIEIVEAPASYQQFLARFQTFLSRAPRSGERRLDLHHAARVRTEQRVVLAESEDISRGGTFLRTTGEFTPEDRISFELDIPGREEGIPLSGRVAYVLSGEAAGRFGREPGIGIQFVDLPSSSRAVLDHHLRRVELHRYTPARRFSGAVPAAGTFTDFTVPELLVSCFEQRTDGILELKTDGETQRVFLQKGKTVFVASSRDPRFAEDRKIREFFFQQGLVDGQSLSEELAREQEGQLQSAFSWITGTYRILPVTEWAETPYLLSIRLPFVLLEGIVKSYPSALLRTWLGLEEGAVVQTLTLPPSEMAVPPKLAHLLQRAALPKTIKALSEKLTLPIKEVIPITYAAILLGWLGVESSNSLNS